jgi:thioesterase domain-containing protein
VPITHKNLQFEAAKMRDWFNLTPDDCCLSFLPLQYAHGLRETTFPPLITGGSVARPANHAQLDIVQWLSRLKPTWYSAFPIFHHSIFELIRGVPDIQALHCLRFILSSGTPLKPELQRGLADVVGVPVLEFYGIGEAGHMSANLPPPGQCKAGTCGIPLPGEMMIAQDGHALPPGQLGEVLVRGPTVVSGYLDNPQTNQECFVDGWFRTGDLGAIDTDGFLSIHGRFKELINRGGEKLAPIEVEQALLRHPAVADAAAFAVPHPRLHEDVAAAVVLRAEAIATPAELRAFVRAHLAPFKIPRLVTIVRALPKDVTGKVRRRELSATLASNAAASSVQISEDPFEHCPLMADVMQLWRNLLQCDSIGLDDDFFVKGGDSLVAVQMRLAVEQLIGRVLPDTILLEAPTVRRFVKAVTECNELETKPLLIVRSDSEGRPLFFFHGDFTSGGYYVRRLADLLGSATTLISVAPHGLGREPLPASIQQMARERLPLILAAQPVGPFRLGGHCNGGTVAFELARLLQAAGHRVELLALIDVPAANAGMTMHLLRRGLAGVLRLAFRDVSKREELMVACMEHVWLLYERNCRFWQMTSAKRRAKMVAKLKLYSASLRHRISDLREFRHFRLRNSPGSSNSLRQRDSMHRIRHYFRALATYFPESLEIPIVYYSAEHSGHFLKGISSQLEIIKLPSDHFSCITTHLHIIAGHLRQRLSCD